jgi:hypothetical protein
VRAKILSHANTTLGKIPYGVLLGKICYAAAPRQMPCVPEPVLVIQYWAIKCRVNPMLELAKGFEPPTL